MKNMARYIILIVLAVVMAFSAGILSLSIKNAPRTAHESGAAIVQLKAGFQKQFHPESELSLSKISADPEAAPLTHPRFIFTQSQ